MSAAERSPEEKNDSPMEKKSTGKTIRRALGYLRPYRPHLAVVTAAILVSSGAQITDSTLLKAIIDDCLTPLIRQYDSALMQKLLHLTSAMFALFVASALGSYLYSYLMLKIPTTTLYKIRTELLAKMEHLPLRYFDSKSNGELMSRFTNDTDAPRDMLNSSMTSFISSFLTVAGIFLLMLWYSWQLTLLTVLLLVAMVNVTRVIGGGSGDAFQKQQAAVGLLNGCIKEMIEGQRVVRVFRHEQAAREEFRRINETLHESADRANMFANILLSITTNLASPQYAFTAVLGCILAIGNILTLSAVVLFLQFARSSSPPLTQTSQQLSLVLNALVGAGRIFVLIGKPPEIDDGCVTLTYTEQNVGGTLYESEGYGSLWAWKIPSPSAGPSLRRLEGWVEFDHVVFSYDVEKPVLNDLSLYADPGEKFAFVGSTRAGKTTITDLINRFYEVQQGSIRFDGIEIQSIKKDGLCRSFALMLQDIHLFTGTVMEDIRYGRLDATDDEVIAAVKLSNAGSFIRHLPQGYDTLLTADGANLSQGQRQLLAIARAVVADPPVLILGEATSSIDAHTEALIEQGVGSLMRGRAVSVIAHHLSTVRGTNRILVLKHGRMTEQGTHEELLAQQGKYGRLYRDISGLS